MTDESPLYLGFDLSTQQLKVIAITSNLKIAYEAVFDFDADATSFGIKKGVLTNEAEREVYAPVSVWLQAIDSVLQRLQCKGVNFWRVEGISGAGQRELSFPSFCSLHHWAWGPFPASETCLLTLDSSQKRNTDSEIIQSMAVFIGVKTARRLCGICTKENRWKHNCTMRSLIPTAPIGRTLAQKPSAIYLTGILGTRFS